MQIQKISVVLFVVALLLPALSPARAQGGPGLNTMPIEELEQSVPNMHPYAYFILAIRKFNGDRKDEAVRWLYVGQIRWRFHIAANPGLPPDGDPALLASMMEVIGRPINEWAGGDFDGLMSSMKAALDWDLAQPNGFTSKEKHHVAYETVRSGLRDYIASVEQRRSEFLEERTRNGLENRG